MPWTAETFQKHKKGMNKIKAKRGAKMANAILSSCLKNGGEQEDCERIAIATTLKRLGSKRLTR